MTLKYEVYGILLITISVIALSGEAVVGRSLSKLFGLFLGKFYFVLALVGIYVGLTVMVKRAWPSGWSPRKSGILLFVLALTLMSSIAEINAKFAGIQDATILTAGTILQTLGGDIRGELLTASELPETPMMSKAISGGYAGAVQYSILFWLFGNIGARFVLIVMFAISVMLITGKSYVELIQTISSKLGRLITLLRLKFKRVKRPSKAGKRQSQPPVVHNEPDDYEDDTYDPYVTQQDESAPELPAEPKKKPAFFSWLQDYADKLRKEPEAATRPPAGRQAAEEEEESLGWQPDDAMAGEKSESADAAPWQAEPETHPELPVGEEAPWPEALVPVDDNLAESPEELDGAAIAEVSGEAAEGETTGNIPEGAAEGAAAVITSTVKPYRLPPLSLLARPNGHGKSGPEGAQESRRKLEATLESFGVKANVLDVVRGPAVTRYEVQPATGVKVSRIVGLTDDIALALAAKDIRMEAPIPGKSAIGIEVPNTEVSVVTMREVMETPAFQRAASKMSIVFGRDIAGTPIVGDLARMPHLLVAGATGSGKSVCINGIITSILYKAKPDEVRFLMIDPKMVELNVYNGIPHLLAPVVTDPRRASLALKKIVVEMEKRYELFSKTGTRNIEGYNTLMADNPAAVLPYIVVIVDELADLMMIAANDVEDAICRLAQMARASGIHLIIATQRPSVDVITGLIKANIPSRIAFGVSSQVDSRTILDMVGAEKLLGRGDMLFLPVGMSKPIRVQGAFLSDQEVESIVTYSRGQAEAEYAEDLVPEVEEISEDDNEELDELYDQAVTIVVEAKQASVSLLQRRMRVGYTRAARLIDTMEAKGIVGPYEGSKPREVLMSPEQFQSGKITS
ncbi:FtsK/SpoIIIE family DNA translocase [Paenibacillus daejeonensis]|uniref:FtsK/SpoIIIE family DNA translocase n=1 Tax=Paenibacillus daejeonensis TaxID=135193 RepID=UPI0003601CD2|nr:DNA translocase FtsK [Paenibacillus daejeonensis]